MGLEDISGRRLGTALREARMAAGLSRRETAERAGCTTRQLRAFERGEAQPDDAQLERLAEAWARPVTAIVPPRGDAPVAFEDGHLHVGETSRSLGSEEPLTDDVLRSYLGVLYELRDSKPGTRIPLRERDMDALADALGNDPEVVETRLVDLMDVTREEAAALRATLIRRRILLPAASIALGATVVAGGAKLIDGGNGTDQQQATVRTHEVQGVAIGSAASVSLPPVEIGDAASADAPPQIGTAASVTAPVEIGDAASVSRDG